jgi:hypothetical protein
MISKFSNFELLKIRSIISNSNLYEGAPRVFTEYLPEEQKKEVEQAIAAIDNIEKNYKSDIETYLRGVLNKRLLDKATSEIIPNSVVEDIIKSEDTLDFIEDATKILNGERLSTKFPNKLLNFGITAVVSAVVVALVWVLFFKGRKAIVGKTEEITLNLSSKEAYINGGEISGHNIFDVIFIDPKQKYVKLSVSPNNNNKAIKAGNDYYLNTQSGNVFTTKKPLAVEPVTPSDFNKLDDFIIAPNIKKYVKVSPDDIPKVQAPEQISKFTEKFKNKIKGVKDISKDISKAPGWLKKTLIGTFGVGAFTTTSIGIYYAYPSVMKFLIETIPDELYFASGLKPQDMNDKMDFVDNRQQIWNDVYLSLSKSRVFSDDLDLDESTIQKIRYSNVWEKYRNKESDAWVGWDTLCDSDPNQIAYAIITIITSGIVSVAQKKASTEVAVFYELIQKNTNA